MDDQMFYPYFFRADNGAVTFKRVLLAELPAAPNVGYRLIGDIGAKTPRYPEDKVAYSEVAYEEVERIFREWLVSDCGEL